MNNIPRKALKIAHEALKVAHRGFHQMHIENTMEAFRAAYAAGCDMVEFDVQLSRDGIPFIFHDDDCLRLIGRVEQACALTWQELQSLSMPLDSSPKHATQAKGVYKIPSLEEFLGEFGQRAFYLELKVPESKNKDTDYLDILGQTSARLVQAAGPHPDTFLGSFHTGLLCRLAKQHAYPRLAGIFDSYANFQTVHSRTDHETATAIQFYSISAEIFQKFLQKAQSNSQPPGMDKILIWDINGEKSFSQARELGVMGLVTDDIETLLAL